MRVLILGEAKSGTTALHRAVCEAMAPPPVTEVFEPEDLTELDLGSDRLVVKKLLGNLAGHEKDAFDRFDRRVLLVRDPRDRMVSSLLYDIHGVAAELDPAKIDTYVDMLRRKEHDPAGVPFLRLTHAYWRLTGKDMLSALARSTQRVNDVLGRFGDQFHVAHYEDLVQGDLAGLADHLGLALGEVPDVGPELQRVVRTKSSGDWQHWFTDKDLLWLRPMVSSTLRRLDYPREWTLAAEPAIDPEHGSRYVERLVAEARGQ